MAGRLTPDVDAAFEALRLLVGSPVPDAVRPHVEFATVDTIRHFARSYGDGNPMYSDPAYASAGVRGELVAPALFPIATGVPSATARSDLDLRGLPGHPHRGVVEDRWTLHRPIPVSTRLERERTLVEVAPQDAGGHPAASRVWTVTIGTAYRLDGATHATHDRVYVFDHASEGVRSACPARHRYTARELADIEGGYARHERRGRLPRHVDDVEVGSVVGPMVKGPLTLTDLVTYRGGVGPGPMGAEALELAYRNRIENPDVYTLDASGVPDTTERSHWDSEYARSRGHSGPYDYSHTRLNWFAQLLSDWMGDGGWIRSLSGSILAQNYVADTHWIEGRVREVATAGEVGVVDIELEGRNQRGEVTCVGSGAVLVPIGPAEAVTRDQIEAFADDRRQDGAG